MCVELSNSKLKVADLTPKKLNNLVLTLVVCNDGNLNNTPLPFKSYIPYRPSRTTMPVYLMTIHIKEIYSVNLIKLFKESSFVARFDTKQTESVERTKVSYQAYTCI